MISINQIAKYFLFNSNYLSLSTSSDDKPWTSPIHFSCDSDFNIYFISKKDSLHSKNIYKNSNVSFCIFNSENTSFTAQCVQASGICEEVKLKEVLKALRVIYKKRNPSLKDFSNINIKEVSGIVRDRVYRIKIEKIYVLDSSNPDMDTRVEVRL